MKRVVIMGRPNVGKSTLFNRLTGSKHALVDDQPGVTRDSREGEGHLGDMEFTVIDTAGLEEAAKGTLAARMTAQTRDAAKTGDVLLLVVDGKSGIIPADTQFIEEARRSGKPVILVVNKCESRATLGNVVDAYSLGLGEPVAISAEHGEGMADLFEALMPHIDAGDEAEETHAPDLQIAVVGRPNAGKSTLINRLLGHERLLTGPEAGITRDAIAVELEYQGQTLKLVDTAGMRKKANVQTKVEKLAVADSLRAIQYAHVVILLVDATAPLEKQDAQIAAHVEQEGRACVIGVNKWDLVEDPKELMEELRYLAGKHMPYFKDLPIIPLSAEKGQGLPVLIKACFAVYKLWNERIKTAPLNRWLDRVEQEHAPPMVKGRRLKLKYITQAKARPPTFSLFVSSQGELPEAYRRYLVNRLREEFDLPGIPIRMNLKKGANPYAHDEEA